jgi:hypothetical protein
MKPAPFRFWTDEVETKTDADDGKLKSGLQLMGAMVMVLGAMVLGAMMSGQSLSQFRDSNARRQPLLYLYLLQLQPPKQSQW